MIDGFDHLVYRAPDLEEAIDDLESRLGVRAIAGGPHPGRGTRNALIALGPTEYLEILAPDPEQPERAEAVRARWPVARLATWALRSTLIETQASLAGSRGLDLGAVEPMSRRRPDGHELRWRVTAARDLVDGLVPFLIDWGESEHPAARAPNGCTILDLRGEHPDPGLAAASLAALDIAMPVARGDRAALVADLETPIGRVELR